MRNRGHSERIRKKIGEEGNDRREEKYKKNEKKLERKIEKWRNFKNIYSIKLISSGAVNTT